ncbi:hypothetical protein NDU88_001915 [Pleurodeles waltl]|uniref:Uncharacterized protein n=1 Tax=Pleurodeles waltl TaxID=8319 RepID=A0AAV7Q7C4_PLEWA|nr:hypothetical protein NDU88_001915 [Pleurodeles waltl]
MRWVDGGLLHQLRLKRQELRVLAKQHTWAYSLASQRRLYDVGKKANKLLVWLDKRVWERSWAREVWSKEGIHCTFNNAIAEASATYYEEVCTSVTRMPGLSEEDRGALDGELTEEEVALAMRGLQLGKAVGPNGLPAEYFRCMGSKIAKHMQAMFQEAWRVGLLPVD